MLLYEGVDERMEEYVPRYTGQAHASQAVRCLLVPAVSRWRSLCEAESLGEI